MVLIKNGHFSNFFFLGNIGQENVFYDILERKNDFLDYKDKKFKKSKNSQFFKGVNPRFWSNNGHISNFIFFRQYRPRKCLLRYSRMKKRLSRLQNKEVQKVKKNWHFSKGVNPWFWYKNGRCSNFFFLGNIGQENVFYHILELKNHFLVYKDKKFKKSKNWHFFKGVNQSFWSKNGHFPKFFFLVYIGQKNVFYDIL